MKKITITEDELARTSAKVLAEAVGDDAPSIVVLTGALLFAHLNDKLCEMSEEEPVDKVYRRSCDRYTVGDFTFYDYTGGTLEHKHRVEYYKAGSFVDKQILPDKEEAFKYILAILSDYII